MGGNGGSAEYNVEENCERDYPVYGQQLQKSRCNARGATAAVLLRFWMAASTSSGVKGSSIIGIYGHSANEVGLICSTPTGFRRLSKCLLNSSSAGFSLVVSFSEMAPFQFIARQIFLGSFSFAIHAHLVPLMRHCLS